MKRRGDMQAVWTEIVIRDCRGDSRATSAANDWPRLGMATGAGEHTWLPSVGPQGSRVPAGRHIRSSRFLNYLQVASAFCEGVSASIAALGDDCAHP